MHYLPEPKPTAAAAGQAIPTDADRDRVRRLIAAIDEIGVEKPTAVRVDDPAIPSHEDGPRVGDTPHVPQPDSRIVPQWATGIAVASIGVGAGSTGLGCAAWLLFKGLSLVSVPGLERFAWIIIAPFAGIAMAATAIGCLISKAKKAAQPEIHNHTYTGDVYQQHSETHSRSVWNKTITK